MGLKAILDLYRNGVLVLVTSTEEHEVLKYLNCIWSILREY